MGASFRTAKIAPIRLLPIGAILLEYILAACKDCGRNRGHIENVAYLRKRIGTGVHFRNVQIPDSLRQCEFYFLSGSIEDNSSEGTAAGKRQSLLLFDPGGRRFSAGECDSCNPGQSSIQSFCGGADYAGTDQ